MSEVEKCKLCGGVIETIEEGNEVVKVCVVCGCPYDCSGCPYDCIAKEEQ